LFPKINPTKTKAWSLLENHQIDEMSCTYMKDLFENDEARFSKYHILQDSILFDYSKNIVTDKTMELLFHLAEECKLKEAVSAMFDGAKINETESRAVYHVGLRDFSERKCVIDEIEVKSEIISVRNKIKHFSNEIHQGKWLGCTGKKIKNIVNIGIGGSDLGPNMICEALKPYWIKDLHCYFISNVDGTNLVEVLKDLHPEETLFVVASKTFTTQETMTNANSARDWFLSKVGNPEFIEKHFVAISSNVSKAIEFGINENNVFEMWDWVCGRFSVYGAIGLSVSLTIGYDNFESFLMGAESADLHFKNEKFESNIPVIMGLLSIWYINFWNAKSEVILCYDQYLHKFATYMQQGFMESNGKSVDRNGEKVHYSTGIPIWGEPGTNGQHSFHQMFHQGTSMIPCDFIAPLVSQNPIGDHHIKLLSNFFAQSEALMVGKTKEAVIAELKQKGLNKEEIEKLTPFKVFDGNKPTNSILIKKIDPFNLGKLTVFYEHKIFVQGIIWNIFSFDQWGVELGKELSTSILPELNNVENTINFSSSTNGMINYFKQNTI
jgi:glucose-6-phosphate isomerase